MKLLFLFLFTGVLTFGQFIPNSKYFHSFEDTQSEHSLVFVKILGDTNYSYCLVSRKNLRIGIFDEYYKEIVSNFSSFLYLIWSEQIAIPIRYMRKLPTEGCIKNSYIPRYKGKKVNNILSQYTSKGSVENTYILSNEIPENSQLELLQIFMKNCYLIFWDDFTPQWIVVKLVD